jgi:3-methylfumaryl-CoA hydratase
VTAVAGSRLEGLPQPAGCIGDLAAWIGRQEIVEERIAPMPSAALRALLDSAEPPPRDGDPLPPLAHWMHFLPLHRQSELAEDGHVRRGGFMPPIPLPRRMFAGARIEFLRPLRIGELARRVGTVTKIEEKQGKTGRLVFVSVKQEIAGEEGLSLREAQDIVYRDKPRADAPASVSQQAAEREQWGCDLLPDSRMLFRYSALIFNAHRIHYDHPYATVAEAYPSLVVHGQLMATFLADLARKRAGQSLAAFKFRSSRAFFADEPVRLSGCHVDGGVSLWASNSGGVAMTAEARFGAP